MKTSFRKLARTLIVLSFVTLLLTFGVVKFIGKMDKERFGKLTEKWIAYETKQTSTGIVFKEIKDYNWAWVSGKIVDFNDTPIAGAVVKIKTMPGNEEVCSKITNADGKFLAVIKGSKISVNGAVEKYSDAQVASCLLSVKKEGGIHYVTAFRKFVITKGDNYDIGEIPLGVYTQMVDINNTPASLSDDGGTFYLKDAHGNNILKVVIPGNAILRITEEGVEIPAPLKAFIPNEGSQLSVPLPPSSIYTYFVDIYPDAVLKDWAEIYIKNTISLPPDTQIPVGEFNSEVGRWFDTDDAFDTDIEEIDNAQATVEGEWIKFRTRHFWPKDPNMAGVTGGDTLAGYRRNRGKEGNNNGRTDQDDEWDCDDYNLASYINLRDGHYSMNRHLRTWTVADQPFSLNLFYSTRYIQPRFLLTFLYKIQGLRNWIREMVAGWNNNNSIGLDPDGYRLKLNLDGLTAGINKRIYLDMAPGEEAGDIADFDIADIDEDQWSANLILDKTNRKFKEGINRLVQTGGLNGYVPYATADRFAGIGKIIVNGVRSSDFETIIGDIMMRFIRIFWFDTSRSPYGAGWTLTIEDKLKKDSDGSVTVVTGRQMPINYVPVRACGPFEFIKDDSKFEQIAVDPSNKTIYIGMASGTIKKIIEGNIELQDFLNVTPPIKAMRIVNGYLYVSHTGGVIKISLNDASRDFFAVGTTITGIDIFGNDLYMLKKERNDWKIEKKGLDGRGLASTVCTLPSRILDPWALAVDQTGSKFFVACRVTARLYKVNSSGNIEEIMYKSGWTLQDAYELINNLYSRYWWAAVNEYVCGVQDVIRVDNKLYLVDARNGVVVMKDLNTDLEWEIITAGERFNPDTGLPLTGIAKFDSNTLVVSAGYLLSNYERIGPLVNQGAVYMLKPGHKNYVLASGNASSYLEEGNISIPEDILIDGDPRSINDIRTNGWCRYELSGTRTIFDSVGNLVGILNANNVVIAKFMYTDHAGKLLLRRIEDMAGNQTILNYELISGRPALKSITYPDGNSTRFTINAGDLEGITDCGDTDDVTYNYDNHLMTSVVDQANNTKSINYGRFGVVDNIDFNNGEVRRFEYGILDNLINNSDSGRTRNNPLNIRKSWNMYTKYTNEEGLEYKTAFNSQGLPLLEIDPGGSKTLYIRDARGLPIAIIRTGTDSNGERKYNAQLLTYDERYNLITKHIELSNAGDDKSLVAFELTYRDYYPNRFMIRPKKLTKIGTSSDSGRIISWIIDWRGKYMGWINDLITDSGINDLLRQITPELSIEYEWDDTGNLERITNPGEQITSVTVNNRGQIESEIDAQGHGIWHEFYDEAKYFNTRLVKIGLNGTSEFSTFEFDYDNQGNIISSIDPAGVITEAEYDAMGRKTEDTFYNTDGGAVTTKYGYNSEDGDCSDCNRGLLSSIEDPKGNIYSFSYDAVNRLEAITDFSDNTTRFTYTDIETIITKPMGTVSFTYDSISGYPTKITIPTADGPKEYGIQPDSTGLTKKIIYPDNSEYSLKWNFQYDGLMTGITYRDDDWVRFRRNDLGGIYEQENSEGIVLKYNYNIYGQLEDIKNEYNNYISDYSYDNNTKIPTTVSAYDEAGNKTSEINYHYKDASYDWWNLEWDTQEIDGHEVRTDYTYDGTKSNYLLKQVNVNGGPRIEYEYYGNNWLHNIKYNGEQIAEFTYEYPVEGDDLLYKITISHPSLVNRVIGVNSNEEIVYLGGTPGRPNSYEYDSNGNPDLVIQDGETITDYDYNDANQLTSVQWPENPEENESYSYNELGERTGSHFQQNFVYTNGQLGQYYYKDNRGRVSMTYDNNGNLKTKTIRGETTTYTWDKLDQLIRVSSPDVDVEYSYDGLGRRIVKTYSDGRKEKYIYDGEDILAVLDKNNNLVSAIIHGSATDMPLAVIRADGEVFYYHVDRLGSIVKVSNMDGNLIGEIDYDAFGRIVGTRLSTDPTRREAFNRFLVTPPMYRFTGRESDVETGLYYYRARYYDPEIGRFISKDPVALSARFSIPDFIEGTYDFDEYNYCGNNPEKFVDPYGNFYFYPTDPFDPLRGVAAHIVSELGNPEGAKELISQTGIGSIRDLIGAAVDYMKPPVCRTRDPFPLIRAAVNVGGIFGKVKITKGRITKVVKFKGGKKGARDPALKGYSDQFRRWFHRVGKEKYRKGKDYSPDEIQELYKTGDWKKFKK